MELSELLAGYESGTGKDLMVKGFSIYSHAMEWSEPESLN